LTKLLSVIIFFRRLQEIHHETSNEQPHTNKKSDRVTRMRGFFGVGLRAAAGAWLHRHHKWGLWPLLAVGLLLNFHYLPVYSGDFMMIAGAIGILFGTLLRIVCFTFTGTADPVSPSGRVQIVTEGPYAVTRNPVYLAEGAMALGIAMMSRMPWFVMATLVASIVIAALVVEWEEDLLRLRYGSLWDDYCHIVPRWFSVRRLVHRDSYAKTRGRVKLITAVRAESSTLLVGLLAILAFLAKANFELFYWGFQP
jgi:protein-S-isoprenylcysteine O-methyltransferase Ste14